MNIAREKRCFTSMEAVIKNKPDLLTEILSRLPAKSLGKFKSVSKQWLSLISSQSFALLHARNRRQPNPAALLFRKHRVDIHPELQVVHLEPDHVTPPGLSSLSDYLNVSSVHVLQSCNGLLLCWSMFDFDPCEPKDIPVACDGYWHCTRYEDEGARGNWYFVCNPTTKQFKRIPFVVEAHFSKISLVFDPLKSPHYRIVYVRTVDEDTYRYRIDLYMSETDSWRMLGIVFSAPSDFFDFYTLSAYCNGNIHWCYRGQAISYYFNVETEQLKTTPMPPVVRELGYQAILYFGESRGSLHLVMARSSLHPPLQFDVWEMASDCSSWFVGYRVNIDILRIAYPNIESFVILELIRAEEEEGSTLVLYVDCKVMAYNLHNRSYKEIGEFKPGDLEPSPEGAEVFHYLETLTTFT